MQKRKMAFVPVIIFAAIALATAQSPQTKPLVKSDATSRKESTKPLTPKSAMPASHKSSTGVPKVTATGANNSAQLARLEQQNHKASAAKNTSAPQRVSPAAKSEAPNPPINFQYQKPNTNTSGKKN